MKQIILIFSLLISLLLTQTGFGQQKNDSALSGKTTDFFMSAYNFHPELLQKGHYTVSLNADMPKYFKYYNPMKHKIDKKMPVVVINDAYFNGHLLYGITDQLNLYVNLPFVDSHHYSPMLFQKGVWFGDIQTGIVYGNLLKGHSKLSLDAQIAWPTGTHKHQMQSIDTGKGAFGFRLGLNGLIPLQKANKDGWQMAYSVYDNYLVSIDKIDQGNEFGAYWLFQKPFHTKVGYFGWENGLRFQYQAADKIGKMPLPNSDLTQLDLNIGGWYQFLEHFYLRFSVPYTLYQNKSFLTKYTVIMQLDYTF